MQENITQEHHLLELETPLGKDQLILTSFTGTEAISRLFHFELEMFSSNPNITPDKLIGKPVGFQIKNSNKPIRFFHGYISRFYAGSMKFREGRLYRADVVPWMWFLTRTMDCCIYQNKSVKDIVCDIFKNFNFSDYSVAEIKNNPQSRPYCVQYRETTFDFISRLLEEEGIFYYFKHEKDKHTLVLSDNITSCKDAMSDDAVYRSGSSPHNCITHWERQFYFGIGKRTQADYDFERPSTELSKSSATLIKTLKENYQCYEYIGGYDPSRPEDAQSKLRIEADDAQYEVISGVSQYPNFQPGTQFKLTTSELDSEKGTYLLTQVVHQANDNTHIAGGEQSHYTNSFTCIPNSVSYRPPRLTPKPSIHGLQTAIVVGPKGEEIYTDKYGRVKVQFHWDRIGKNDDKSSCWIRLAQTWAGKQWGTLFIPRIGQEVVVSFLEGDPNQPLIIGSVYNAEQMPPYTLPANNTQSGIKTHSSKKGGAEDANELCFEDKKGEEKIYIHAQKDFKRTVENDDSLEVKNNQTTTIKKDRVLTVSEGNESTTLKKGNRSLTIENGSDTQTIKSDRTVIIESGNLSETIKQGNRQVEISMGNDTLTIKQGNQITKVNLGSSTTEAMQGIQLKVGSNSIKIDQAGITIQGLKVSIAGTLTQIKADASLKLEGAIVQVDGSGMVKIQGALTMVN